MKKSNYENDIENLIFQEGDRKIVHWLRKTISTRFEQFKRTNGTFHITPTDLMKMVKSDVIAEIEINPNLLIKSRAEIIFKFLCSVHQPKRHSDKGFQKTIDDGINQINFNKKFPIHDPSSNQRGGHHDNYKSIANILIGKSPGSFHSLKFTFAVFGILPEDYKLNEKNVSKKISTLSNKATILKKNGQVPSFKRIPKKLTILLMLVIALLVSGFMLYTTFRKRENEKIRPRISTTVLFGDTSKLIYTPSILEDSIILSTTSIHFDDYLIKTDTIALNNIKIRLRLQNYSSWGYYFPDALYLKPVGKSALNGLINKDTKNPYTNSVNLLIELKNEQKWLYEWIILNNGPKQLVPPLSEVNTLLEITKKDYFEPSIQSFEIILKFHDIEGNDYLIKSDQTYQIGFD